MSMHTRQLLQLQTFTLMDAFECDGGMALKVDDASCSADLAMLGPVSKAKGVEVACEHLLRAALFDFLPFQLMLLPQTSP